MGHGLGRKRSDEENEPKGSGPNVAKVAGGWVRRGKHIPLPGGTGQFEYIDSKGNKIKTERFTLIE